MIGPILDFVASGRPFFGICVGMQMILHEGLEFGTHAGLGLIEGQVESISSKVAEADQDFKIPHIGWSKLTSGPAFHPDSWYTSPLFGESVKSGFIFCTFFFRQPG